MKHSDKILAQQAVKAAIDNGVTQVVISPGSRNAPLIIEWQAYQKTKKFSIVDERVAGFFALGLALSSGKPVALVCTSGSALLNYYPAIVEAYYSNIPLIVMSADRPKDLIDIGDGQTIRQQDVYRNHIGKSIGLDENHPENNTDKLKTAFRIIQKQRIPIHINIPFAEPIYNTTDDALLQDDFSVKPNRDKSLLDETPVADDKMETLADIWQKSTRKMVLIGVNPPDDLLKVQLEHLTKDPSVVVMTESTSNVYHQKFINHIDRLIFPWSEQEFEQYKPDLLISIGGYVVSKKIKQLLRAQPPKQHWHIDRYQKLDTFHVLTEYIDVSPQLFFSQLFFKVEPTDSHYQSLLLKENSLRAQKQNAYIAQCPFSDLKVYHNIQTNLPDGYHIHFANSAAIRYAQFFDWSKSPHISCNRGVSGIDGSSSTAMGLAVNNTAPTLLITGDLSFFYDSNALWNTYTPDNFRIVLINNSGGGIFRFIPGPTDSDALDYFETPHGLNASHLCKMYGIEYLHAENPDEFNQVWQDFYSPSNTPKLIEVFTPQSDNSGILKDFFKAMK